MWLCENCVRDDEIKISIFISRENYEYPDCDWDYRERYVRDLIEEKILREKN